MAYPTMWLVIFFTTAAAIQLDWDTAATSDLSGEAAPTPAPPAPITTCVWDGAEDCDAVWYESGVTCQFLEGYSWDCTGCACPGDAPAPAPIQAPTTTERASAVGDPHLSNMAGEHFDIYQPGTFTLLQVPRRPGAPGATLLRVEADARRMGDVCSLYFQAVNISGTWTNQSKPIIFVANARGFPDGMKYNQWMHFGPVDLKVKYRKKGVEFLNIYANSVGRTGYAVGGLLGSDDHTAVSIRPRQCSHSARRAMLASSVAETQW